jgi:hypothetical protein
VTQARIRVEPELACLTRSAWERLIYEANFGVADTEVARMYFIDHICQIDIAIEKDTDRTQISRKIRKMQNRLVEVKKTIPS